MPLAFRSDETSPFVRALFADLGLAPGEVPLEIDARDEMLEFFLGGCEGDRERALFTYFRFGWSIAETLVQVLRWRFGDLGRIGSLMDFACGYGRVTRFLLHHVPAERVWVSDIYSDAVRFQEERFGVHGVVSAIRPEDFSCEKRFDAILVTSLFTHLPEERFVGWLRRLLGLLQPGGILIWSVHDESVRDPGLAMSETGFLFQELSESNTLETSDYGSTWVTEGFVRSALEKASGEPMSLWRAPRGLCDFQDLYVVVREEGVDVSGLAVHPEPLLQIDRCALEQPDLLALSGWCAVRGGQVREVQVSLDGRIVAASPVEGLRADVATAFGDERMARSGWALLVPLPAGTSRSSAILIVRVVDERGAGHPLWASTVDTALFSTARQDVDVLRRGLEELQARLTASEARAAAEIAELEARIAAMEASRFWKLRNAWFRFKGSFGFGDPPP